MDILAKNITQGELVARLNSFDPAVRRKALIELSGQFVSPNQYSDHVNMHIHSFFSYNSENWSPSRIAWEYAQKGVQTIGIVDFDVLDGREEFLRAGELLRLRTSVGLETRAFLSEYSDKVIDSPGEPGVSYILAGGFVKDVPQHSGQSKMLNMLSETSRKRNIALIDRINPHVPEISIDYQLDVIPLTPSGNATERHIISAYVAKAEKLFPDPVKLSKYWSELLRKSLDETNSLLQSRASFEEVVRSKFAKKGGFGYVQPTSETFPRVEDFFTWAISCGAIPMESWLDGTSEGEANGKALLECSRSKGACALNLIPDRNWNIKDPEVKATKLSNLRSIIQVAESMDMPLHIGTEMNKKGLPFVDDIDNEALKPFKKLIIEGSQVFAGHSILARFAGVSYSGKEAVAVFGNDIKSKNKFFAAVGALPAVDSLLASKLSEKTKEDAFDQINDAVKAGNWNL